MSKKSERSGAEFYERLLSKMECGADSVPKFSSTSPLTKNRKSILQEDNKIMFRSRKSLNNESPSKTESLEEKENQKENLKRIDSKESSSNFYKKAVCELDENSIPDGSIISTESKIDFTSTPVEKLLKGGLDAKSNAFQRLKIMFENKLGNTECFEQFSETMIRVPKITNPKLLREAKECFKTYVKNAPKLSLSKIADQTMKSIILCLLGSSKFSSIGIEMATEIIVKTDDLETLLRTLEKEGISNKKPMVVLGCSKLLKNFLSEYGPFVINVSYYQKHLLVFFASPNPQVRKSAMELAREMYRWGGEEFLDFSLLQGIKKSQETELKTAIEKVNPKSAKPSRISPKVEFSNQSTPLTPLKVSKLIAPKKTGALSSSGIDIIAKTGATQQFLNHLEKSKWKTKKEFLDKIAHESRNAKSLKLESDPQPLLETLGRLLKDVNVHVALSALKILPPLFKAGGESLEQNARRLFPIVLAKFREKRKAVEGPAFEALDAFIGTGLTFDSVFETIELFLKDKIPRVRECVLIWVSGILEKNQRGNSGFCAIDKTEFQLAKTATKLFDDSAVAVRNEALRLFVVLLKSHSDDKVLSLFEELKTKNPRAHNKIANLRKNVTGNVGKAKKSPKYDLIREIDVKKNEKMSGNQPENHLKTPVKRKITCSTPRFPAKVKRTVVNSDDEQFKELVEILGKETIESLRKKPSNTAEILKGISKKIRCLNSTDDICSALFNFIGETLGWNNAEESIWVLATNIVIGCQNGLQKDVYVDVLNRTIPFLNPSTALKGGFGKFIFACCESMGPQIASSLLLKNFKKTSEWDETLIEWISQLLDDFDSDYFDDLRELKEWIETVQNRNENAERNLKFQRIKKICEKIGQNGFESRKRIEFEENDTKVPTEIAVKRFNVSPQCLTDISNENSWQRRHKGLKHLSKELEGFEEDSKGLIHGNLQTLLVITKTLGPRLRDNILMISRMALALLDRIFKTMKNRRGETVDQQEMFQKVFGTIECEMLLVVSKGNKLISSEAGKSIANWVAETGIFFVFPKLSELLRGTSLSKGAKKPLLIVLTELLKKSSGREKSPENEKVKNVKDLLKALRITSKERELKRLCNSNIEMINSRFGLANETRKDRRTLRTNKLGREGMAKTSRKDIPNTVRAPRIRSKIFSRFKETPRKSSARDREHKEKVANPFFPAVMMKCGFKMDERMKEKRSFALYEEINGFRLHRLRDELSLTLSADLHGMFFKGEQKSQQKSVRILTANFEKVKDAIMDQIDLVFLLISWIISVNSSATSDCLALLRLVVDWVDKKSFMFNVRQTDNLVPFLIMFAPKEKGVVELLMQMSLSVESDSDFTEYFFGHLELLQQMEDRDILSGTINISSAKVLCAETLSRLAKVRKMDKEAIKERLPIVWKVCARERGAKQYLEELRQLNAEGESGRNLNFECREQKDENAFELPQIFKLDLERLSEFYSDEETSGFDDIRNRMKRLGRK